MRKKYKILSNCAQFVLNALKVLRNKQFLFDLSLWSGQENTFTYLVIAWIKTLDFLSKIRFCVF